MANIVKNSTLKTILLDKCSCEMLSRDQLGAGGQIKMEIGLKVDEKKTEEDLIEKFFLNLTFNVSGYKNDFEEQEGKKMFFVETRFISVFEINDVKLSKAKNIPKIQLETLAQPVYTLAREHIVQLLNSMGILNVQLPWFSVLSEISINK